MAHYSNFFILFFKGQTIHTDSFIEELHINSNNRNNLKYIWQIAIKQNKKVESTYMCIYTYVKLHTSKDKREFTLACWGLFCRFLFRWGKIKEEKVELFCKYPASSCLIPTIRIDIIVFIIVEYTILISIDFIILLFYVVITINGML